MTGTASLGELLSGSVPMVRTLNVEYVETTAERAVLRMADQAEFHNHLGGPHAGAVFTLAESASGAVVVAAFANELSRAAPLPVRAEIAYKTIARGTMTATATPGRPAAEVVGELDTGGRPEFPVAVTIVGADGATVAEMTVFWTLRPNQ